MLKVAFVMGQYPEQEFKRRADVALSYASEEVHIGIFSTQGTAYVPGNTPAFLDSASSGFVEVFREVERQGYDAAVPLGVLDLGVDAGRCAVDIPIIAPAEAMLHLACIFGHRFGIVMYHESRFPLVHRIVERYGMLDRVAGWRSSGFEGPDIAANSDAMVQNFVAESRSLIEQDRADVIISFGITQCPVHIKPAWLSAQLGVPVMEGIGAPLRLAAMAAHLGLRHSRKYWPKIG
ncbi:aspartate/glutamate racemase family protein [Paraburkholderia caffeinilytica]|uniref:aspartate/glutamate racemase family protein n=1 Tax=Paraburkholderia caffeinilytica TaxID=1761016 RepID=UPI0038BCE898